MESREIYGKVNLNFSKAVVKMEKTERVYHRRRLRKEELQIFLTFVMGFTHISHTYTYTLTWVPLGCALSHK